MTRNWLDLERFFCDSFPEGRTQRELRLSMEEQRYLQDKYPHVAWTPQGDPVSGKIWYQAVLPTTADCAW